MKAAELLNVIIDLQSKLQDAQAATAAIQSELSETRAKQRQLEDWSAEKAHYSLQKLDAGGLVYRYRTTRENDAPPHELCADCYQRNTKSILQATAPVDWHKALKCNGCGSVVFVERISQDVFSVGASARGKWDDFA